MRICNVMFGKGLGGIEQSFIDYSRALKEQGHQVTALIHPKAKIANTLAKHGISMVRISNFGQWDPFAVKRIQEFLHSPLEPDIIIAHGNRAAILMRKAVAGKIPVIGVCHNYSIKHILKCDGALTITHDLRQKMIEAGMAENRVHYMPNMIDTRGARKPSAINYHTPVIIGAMGRFVKKKGFDVFIRSLAILKERGVEFSAILGGTGEEEATLRKKVTKLKLDDEIEFTGWVQDKQKFFDDIDIFCLPSNHEPFGIILLESFLHGKPTVTTDSEGPKEIATDGKDALIVSIGNANAMANAMEQLIKDKKLAQELAEAGYNNVQQNYAMEKLGKQLTDILPNARKIWKKGL